MAGTHQQLAIIRLRAGLTGLDVSPDGRSLYVTASEPSRNLLRIDLATNQMANEFNVGDGALEVATGRDPERVFVSTANNRLLFWDTGANRATATLEVDRRPEDIAVAGPAPAPSPVVPGGSPSPAVLSGSPTPAATPSPTSAQTPTPTSAGQPAPTTPTLTTPGPPEAPTPQVTPTP